MLEDFWLPRREGGRGTEISTLEGGQNLGEMGDVEYLQRKLFRALNVPLSRLETDNGFNMGRSAEITRDEVKFYKFVQRLRTRFCNLFTDLLRTQLLLKGVITNDDWENMKHDINFQYNEDSYFAELRETEILRERLELIGSTEPYVGKYFSEEYIRRHILHQDDETILRIDSQISKEQDQEPEIEGTEEPEV
jgi:hypothetical protein